MLRVAVTGTRVTPPRSAQPSPDPEPARCSGQICVSTPLRRCYGNAIRRSGRGPRALGIEHARVLNGRTPAPP